MRQELFDRDYFECGLETGKSCYQNYRWIPELTIPMAMTMIDYLGIAPNDTVLDFGCAKGFLVKAMRWLNRRCYGYDISRYAISNCDPEVTDFCYNGDYSKGSISLNYFDFCIAKDTFEHIPLKELEEFLSKKVAEKYFIVVPLGEQGKFRAPANDMDVTHVNCLTEKNWMDFFELVGMTLETFTYKVRGIKDSYYEKYPKSHGFFTLCH